MAAVTRQLRIGVTVHAEPDQLLATLASLRAHTPEDGVQVVLLPDGPDRATRAALDRLAEYPRLGTDRAFGSPACFNRLAASAGTDDVLLLESGAKVTPGWLDRLRGALAREPSAGLAGPSTNAAWNEQRLFPSTGDDEESIAAAAVAAAQHGDEVRSLEPLYSLSEFCLLVRREVIDAIGAADTGYGLGPCWEMEYSARAARAGFRGLWVMGAYVHRAPFTERRKREERALFEASKRRYQDALCGRRLRREQHRYEAHCQGDACQDFAPRALIRLHRPLAGAAGPAPGPGVPRRPVPPSRPAPARPAPVMAAGRWHFTGMPLVSCIMPTADRRAFIPRAVQAFLAQDYPALELVVLDDGADPVQDLLPADPRIRYLRGRSRQSIGDKRNAACDAAAGELIFHWDDDDWYPPGRVRRQVEAMRARGAGLSGTSRLHFLDRDAGEAWLYTYAGQERPWVAGATLGYWKRLWAQKPFPAMAVGEDNSFLRAAHRAGVADLEDPWLCVASIHSGNTSRKATSGAYWTRADAGEVLKAIQAAGQPARPLVSCIMPTRDRRPFIPLALAGFREQDYPNTELVVVDDGADPVGDLLEGEPRVRYVRAKGRPSIGEKRNLAVQHAHGEFVAHWDDDDWYAPGRLSAQVQPLLAGQADLSGLRATVVVDLRVPRFWGLSSALHQRMFVGDISGGTLMFRRSLFDLGLRYPAINLAEDAHLIREAQRAGQRLAKVSGEGLFVYVRHGRNTWRLELGRHLDAAGWEEGMPPPAFTAAVLEGYRQAAAALG